MAPYADDLVRRKERAEWSSGDIVWIVEAVGTPAAVNKILKKLKGTTWKGKTVKTRTRNKEKRITVRELA